MIQRRHNYTQTDRHFAETCFMGSLTSKMSMRQKLEEVSITILSFEKEESKNMRQIE